MEVQPVVMLTSYSSNCYAKIALGLTVALSAVALLVYSFLGSDHYFAMKTLVPGANSATKVPKRRPNCHVIRCRGPAGSRRMNITNCEHPLILLYNSWGRFNDWDGLFLPAVTDMRASSKSLWYQPACPHQCYFTRDVQSYEKVADLVVVATAYSLGRKFNRSRILDRQNRTGQLWLAALLESPYYVGSALKPLDSVFNWIGSHRQGADFYWPYGWFYPLPVPDTINMYIDPQKSRFLTKRKPVAWLVSHCHTQSKREQLVRTLQKYIKIDVYGDCGKLTCPDAAASKKGIDCRTFLQNNYKFYLAFENSLCLDYVTEKFFYSYLFDMVPVTFGWADYERIAPPGSYINALDFKTVKDLANYLKYLHSHDDEYLKYFWWRSKFGLVARKNPDALCRLCAKIKEHVNNCGDEKFRVPRYQSVLKWYSSLKQKGKGEKNSSALMVGGRSIRPRSYCIYPNDEPVLRRWIAS